jgi:exonuclease VII small subunit
MVPALDILRVLKDGASLWMEAAQTLEEAKARVQQLAATESGPT